MNAPRKPRKSSKPSSAADAAERLARIVDAAEQAAASVIDDAERQAQQQLEEAGERANRIVADKLRQLADELDPPGAGERRVGHLKPVEAPGEAGHDARPARRSGEAGARLLATQMAVTGAGREEIERRLKSDFEIADAAEILDAILGPEEGT